MHMLGTVLTRLQVKVTSLISNVTTLIRQLLYNCIGVLTAMQTQFVGSLTNLSCQFALIAQKFKALVAQFITLASSTKVVLTTAKATLTVLGQQLLTTVLQIRQLVTQAWKQGKSLVKKDTQDQSQK